VRQQDLIVAYRAPYINNVLGQEEPRPIHVKDVDKLVDEYILKFNPQVIASGESNVTTITTTLDSKSSLSKKWKHSGCESAVDETRQSNKNIAIRQEVDDSVVQLSLGRQ
ncbi:MAG: hypothetical protein ACK559_07255, partial [bacterium]